MESDDEALERFFQRHPEPDAASLEADNEVAERVIERLRFHGFRRLPELCEGDWDNSWGMDVWMTLGGPSMVRLNRDRGGYWNAWFGDDGERDPIGNPQLVPMSDWMGVLAGVSTSHSFAEETEFLLQHLDELCELISDAPRVANRLRNNSFARAMRASMEHLPEDRKIEVMYWDWALASRPAFREFASCVADGSVPADREMALTAFAVLVASAVDTGPGEWEAATARAIVERAVGVDGDMGGCLDTVETIVGSGPLAPYREIIRES